MLGKIKKVKLKLSDFISLYKKNIYLSKECKKKDEIIKALEEQIETIKEAMSKTKDV